MTSPASARRPLTSLLFVTGAIFVVLLEVGWWRHTGLTSATLIVGAFVALALASRTAGLLAFAGIGPFTTVLGELTGAPGRGSALLEQMVAACVIGELLRAARESPVRTRIAAPGLVVAAIAMGSAMALVPALAAPIEPAIGAPSALLRTYFTGAFLPADEVWAPIVAGIFVLLGAAFGWAVERSVRVSPGLASRLVLMTLIAHAGSAGLNLSRVVGAAWRSGEAMAELPVLLARARVSMQTDWNAAGSAFLLAILSGVGLVSGSRARRLGIGALLAMALLGLWLTGSRAALVAGLMAMAMVTVWMAVRTGGTARRVAIIGVFAVIVGAVVLVAAYPRGRNPTVSDSIQSRLLLSRLGLQMFRDAPVFGVGITQFYARSGGMAGPELLRWGPTDKENAHNNFIQVLAEQGAAGLGALCVLLAAIGLPAIRQERGQRSWLRVWLIGAIVGCLLTWMTGHPMLVPEFSLLFWLYLGILAGQTTEPKTTSWTWMAAIVAIIVLFTIPTRARLTRDEAYLEHLARGLSPLWMRDDSQRYRTAGNHFTLFLPSSDAPNIVPIRLAPGAPPGVVVVLTLEGRTIASLAPTEAWQDWPVVVPRSSRRFEEIEGTVRTDAPADGVLIRLGKDSLATGR
jgi:O-antigen ligase